MNKIDIDAIDYVTYFNERHHRLEENYYFEQRFQDKCVINYSIACIGASFAYLSFILNQNERVYYLGSLYLCWFLCVIAFVSVYLSSIFAKYDSREAIKELNNRNGTDKIYEVIETKFSKGVGSFNKLGLISFVVAVVFFSFFILNNQLLSNSENGPCLREVQMQNKKIILKKDNISVNEIGKKLEEGASQSVVPAKPKPVPPKTTKNT